MANIDRKMLNLTPEIDQILTGNVKITLSNASLVYSAVPVAANHSIHQHSVQRDTGGSKRGVRKSLVKKVPAIFGPNPIFDQKHGQKWLFGEQKWPYLIKMIKNAFLEPKITRFHRVFDQK